MYNILKPEIICIEGRRYRANDPIIEVTSLQEHDLYENDIMVDEHDDNANDDSEEEFEVVKINDSRFSTSFHVPMQYLGSVIGKKGAVRSRIEHETKTEIKIPRQGQTGDVVVLGSNVSNVKSARRRINMIITSSRMKQKPTHFLSIPFNSSEIMDNFNKFKEEVLRRYPDCGIDETLFNGAGKLHLTLAVLSLMDNEERNLASKLLSDAREKIILPLLEKHPPLKLRLKGVSYMNDDPKEINVLYGLVEEQNAPKGLLQNLTDALIDYFYNAGFIDKYRNSGKLHVTLMNSRYRDRDETSQDARKVTPRSSFDGSRILKDFAEYDFGLVDFKEIHLSLMHSSSSSSNEYYQATCVVSCL